MHGRSLIKKVGKITEYSVTRTRIGPWPIFFLGRLHARVGQTLASSATSFPPTKSFHQLPSVPKERTHHARSSKSCVRPERVGRGPMATWRCAHALSSTVQTGAVQQDEASASAISSPFRSRGPLCSVFLFVLETAARSIASIQTERKL